MSNWFLIILLILLRFLFNYLQIIFLLFFRTLWYSTIPGVWTQFLVQAVIWGTVLDIDVVWAGSRIGTCSTRRCPCHVWQAQSTDWNGVSYCFCLCSGMCFEGVLKQSDYFSVRFQRLAWYKNAQLGTRMQTTHPGTGARHRWAHAARHRWAPWLPAQAGTGEHNEPRCG